MTKEYFEMSVPLYPKRIETESVETPTDLGICHMMSADTVTRNGTYYPYDELEKSVPLWEGLPILINHETDDIRTVVGHLSDVKMNSTALTCKPVFESTSVGYPIVQGYINARVNANAIPNVSIGVWANAENSEKDGEEIRILRDYEPDHLGIVVNGSCNPALGCGIGYTNSKFTVKSEDYVEKSEEYENLIKEILKEEIELERNKND